MQRFRWLLIFLARLIQIFKSLILLDHENRYHYCFVFFNSCKYHEEYRAVTRQVQGPNRDEYLSDLIQLADRYLDPGDYAKAEKLLLEGKGLGTVKQKWNCDLSARLFQLYAEQGDGAKADPFFNEAKQIRNKGHWGAFVLIGV